MENVERAKKSSLNLSHWVNARFNEFYSGNITSSRAMIESTLKYILKYSNTPFKSGNDISSLWQCVKGLLFPAFSNEPAKIKKMVGSVSMMIVKIKLIRNNDKWFYDINRPNKLFLEIIHDALLHESLYLNKKDFEE
jgi:hypothetical protein